MQFNQILNSKIACLPIHSGCALLEQTIKAMSLACKPQEFPLKLNHFNAPVGNKHA